MFLQPLELIIRPYFGTNWLLKLTIPPVIEEIFHILWNPTVHYHVYSTKAHNLSLSGYKSTLSTPCQKILKKSILIVNSRLRLGLPSGLPPWGLPTKTLYTSLLSVILAHAPPISFFWILSPEFDEEYSSEKISEIIPLSLISALTESFEVKQYIAYLIKVQTNKCGPGSSGGIVTDWLRAGRSGIESRLGRDFPPVQTGPGAYPASCKMGTGCFPGVKCGRGVLLNTHPLLVLRSWKSGAILLPTLWATPGL